MKKIGLALAGGGVKGSYQIGSFYAFKKCHIKFNGIVGTSIGAFNAAALASKNEYELYKLWKNIDPGELLGIDPEIVRFINNGKIDYKTFLGFLKTTKKVLKNRGLSNYDLKKVITKLVDIKKIKNNNIDFGLTTLNVSKRKPIYIYKEDIKEEDFVDYIMASCSLPVFKLERTIDNSYYFDGGFFDNCPSIMLIKKNYDIVYEVKINGIGINRKYKNNNTKVIKISPSRSNGSILEMNHQKIIDNIYMGYYDTLKVLNKYIGKKYTFYKPLFLNYSKMLKNIRKSKINYLKKYYKVNTDKDLIITILEIAMQKEKYSYNKVYKIKEVLKNIPKKNKLIYNFVKDLRIPLFVLYNR